ncbi:hypothetical protein TRFO_14990 [Tritrichomonas foetus]|uniref:Fungal lipase-type domain-containing protein n=1 Tax=Tritrichomonas foetus TaxID=1144522 RepID=A0A1J4KTG2_9EUKA|nr:hypothetical protein TRFO_14990 [Tritrichomonas foetus]|eukprot:OHT14585.1 hypothetical protein TRFO_14990 [Tritrichomonas foetus]
MRRSSEYVQSEMRSIHTLFDPIDFVLKPSQISTLSCPSVPTDLEFVIDGRSYRCNKGLARSVFTNVNDQLNNNPKLDKIVLSLDDPKCYFQIIQCMLAGEVITINEENANFLNNVATTLGNDELRLKTEIYLSRYKNGDLQPAKWYQQALNLIFSFFSNISMVSRIFLFLCELIGYAIGIAFIFNLFMVPLTSGIISPTLSDSFRYGLMIPYFLFNINIVSLIEIITFYICKSNHFISQIPFPKHIQLLKLIKKVWPFCNKPVEVQFSELELSSAPMLSANKNDQSKKYNDVKKKFFLYTGQHNVYNAILGLILTIVCIFFIFTEVFRYVMVFFTVYLPTFMVATVIILYSFLAILSIFPKARTNFIENGDFSDPFVNSMYFTESKWSLLLHRLFKKFKKNSNPYNNNDITTNEEGFVYENNNNSNNKTNRNSISINANSPTIIINTPNPTPTNLNLNFHEYETILKQIFFTIFSKATAGFIIAIGLLLMIIIEHDHFEPSQAILIFLIVIFLLIPLMSSINFPFLIHQRFFFQTYSESQVKLQDKWMHNSRQRVTWLKSWFTWSKDATSIRVSRIIFIIFYIIVGVGSIFPAMIFKQEDLVDDFNNTFTRNIKSNPDLMKPYNDYLKYQNKYTNGNKTIYLMNPVCEIKVDELTIYQLSALAEASYQYENDDPTLHSMLSVFFGENWNTTLQIIDDAPKSEISHSNVRHFIYKDRIHIVSIRGTANTVDVLADVELWASSFIMNILSSSIPIFNGYVSDFRTFLGYAMHLPRFMFKPFSLINGYINVINKFVSNIQLGNGTEIILVGHSLGGGLAKLISTMTGYRAISYSGPGIQALTAFYQWKDDHIAQSFTNIVPNLDPVSGVDTATGSSFLIPCDAGMIACHNIIRTMCMLSTLCNNLTLNTYSFCIQNLGSDEMIAISNSGRPYSYIS